jgi:hypothetical protein
MAGRSFTRHLPRLIAGAAFLLTAFVAAPGFGDDHARARAARDAGEIRPLNEIMDAVKRDNPGEVVEVELEREHGRWIYEVKILTPQGEVRKLDYDARSAERLPARPRRDGGERKR